MTTSRKILLPIIIVAMLLALAGMLFLSFANTDSQAVALAEEVNHTPTNVTTHTNHNGWTVITSDIGTLSDGNYYLDSDVTISRHLMVSGTVTVCLNGHIMRGTGGDYFFDLEEGANFTLEDCNTSVTHKYYVDDAQNGLYVVEGATDFEAGYAAATTKGTIAGGILTNGYGYGSGVLMGYNCVATINGGTMCGNRSQYYATVYCSTVMNGGAICGNTGGQGAGVYGALTMNGGVISNNYGTSGGGVYGRLIMSGGTISDNVATYQGGGVYVTGNSNEVTITGGTISNNTATEGGGGIYAHESVEITISGGTISGNTTTLNGGGIYVGYECVLTLSENATISGNSAVNGGGIECRNFCTVNVIGGTISNNTAIAGGGGVAGTIDMSGGTISGNTAVRGGGIFAGEGYSITINGGTISGNTANAGGGGVFTRGTLVVNNGTISGNTVTNGEGGGIYVALSTPDSSGGQDAKINGGEIINNVAKEGGGLYVLNALAELSGGYFASNTNTSSEIDEFASGGSATLTISHTYFASYESLMKYQDLWAICFNITPNFDEYKQGYPYMAANEEFASSFATTIWTQYIQQATQYCAALPVEYKLALTDNLVQQFTTTSGETRLPLAIYYLDSDVTLSKSNVMFGQGSNAYNGEVLGLVLDLNGHTLSTADGSTAIAMSAKQNINIVDSVGNGRLEGGILLGSNTPVNVVSGTVARITAQTSDIQLSVGNSGKVEELYIDTTVTFENDTFASQLVLDKLTVASGEVVLFNCKVSAKLVDVLGGSCQLDIVDATVTDVYEIHVADGATLSFYNATDKYTKFVADKGSDVIFESSSNIENSVIDTTAFTTSIRGDFRNTVFNGDVADIGDSRISVEFGEGITINGNLNMNSGFIFNEGDLTINGSINISGGLLSLTGSAKVTGDIAITNYSYGFTIENIVCDGTLTITDSTGTVDNVQVSSATITGGDVTFSNSTIDTVVASGAVTYKQGNSMQSVTVDGAALTIDTTDEVVNNSIFTLDTVTTLTVKSGTFVVTDLDITGKLGSGNGTIELGTGAALTISEGATVDNNVVVTSGTFAMTAGNLGGRLSKAQDATGTVSVSGGNFAYPIDSAFLAEGSIAVLLEDGEAGYNAQYPYVIYTIDEDGTINSVIVAWQTTEFTYNGKVLDASTAGVTITDGEGNPIEQAYTVEYSYVLDGVTYYGLPKNAGTYDFTVTLYFKNTDATTAYTATGALSGITILPKELTVIWDKSTTSFTYDGKEHAPYAQVLFGVASGDNLGLTVQGKTANAGTHTAQATITNGNYVLANPECQYTINKKVVEVVWDGNVEFVYNGQAQAPTATAESGIEGVELTLTVAGNTNAGDYTATATDNSGNFELTNATLNYTIAKKRVAVVWSNTELTYTGEAIAPTATVETGVEGETLTLTITGGQTKNGTYSAAASIDNPNYELTNYYTTYTIAGGPEGGMSGLATAMLVITILGVLGAGGTFAFVMIKSKRG